MASNEPSGLLGGILTGASETIKQKYDWDADENKRKAIELRLEALKREALKQTGYDESRVKFLRRVGEQTDPRAVIDQTGDVPTPYLAAGRSPGAKADITSILANMNLADVTGVFDGDMEKALDWTGRLTPDQMNNLITSSLSDKVSNAVRGAVSKPPDDVPTPYSAAVISPGAKLDFNLDTPPVFDPFNGFRQEGILMSKVRGDNKTDGIPIGGSDNGRQRVITVDSKGKLTITDSPRKKSELQLTAEAIKNAPPEMRKIMLELEGLDPNSVEYKRKESELKDIEIEVEGYKRDTAKLEFNELKAKSGSLKIKYQQATNNDLRDADELLALFDKLKRARQVGQVGVLSDARIEALKFEVFGSGMFNFGSVQERNRAKDELATLQQVKILMSGMGFSNALKMIGGAEGVQSNQAEFKAADRFQMNINNEMAVNKAGLLRQYQMILDISEANPHVKLDDQTTKRIKSVIKKLTSESPAGDGEAEDLPVGFHNANEVDQANWRILKKRIAEDAKAAMATGA